MRIKISQLKVTWPTTSGKVHFWCNQNFLDQFQFRWLRNSVTKKGNVTPIFLICNHLKLNTSKNNAILKTLIFREQPCWIFNVKLKFFLQNFSKLSKNFKNTFKKELKSSVLIWQFPKIVKNFKSGWVSV